MIFYDSKMMAEEAAELFSIFDKVYDEKMEIECYVEDSELEGYGVYTCSGASRVVFGLEFGEFVFKTDIKEGYCNKEFLNYQYAIKHGYSEYFCPIEYVGEYHGKHWFGMPKLYCVDNEYGISEISDRLYQKLRETHSKENAEQILEELENDSEEAVVREYFTQYYGNVEYETFENFLWKYDINDLHSGNVGFIDDFPVFIDYSGYVGTIPCDVIEDLNEQMKKYYASPLYKWEI